MTTRSSKKHSEFPLNVLAGVGAAALAVAAAGTYFLYGTKAGVKGRKRVKGWMLKAKGEVLEKIESLKELNEKIYHEAIDAVADQYRKLQHIDGEEVEALVKELKGYWKHIRRSLQSGKKAAQSFSKRSGKARK
ncbi:MAG: hypothetical protein AAB567_02635 [Patescibacteria group bacterium]